MASLARSRPEHLQKTYSAYEKARAGFAAEIADVFEKKSGLPSLRGKTLLDIGCGNGEIAEAFSCMGLAVTGIEYSSSRVKRMAAQHRNFRLIAGDGHYIPLESRCFDFAVLADVLEHVHDPARMMREVARVVKTGGLVFIGATNRCSIVNLLSDPHYNAPLIPLMSKNMAGWYVTKLLKLSSSFNVEKYFFPGEITRKIENSGFICEDLPLYRKRLTRGQIGTAPANGLVRRLLSFSLVRKLAPSLSSTWLFRTFVAPTFYFIAVRKDDDRTRPESRTDC